MKRLSGQSKPGALGWVGVGIAALCVLALFSNGGAAAGRRLEGVSGPPAAPQATPGQDFQDVVPADPFYPYLHNLAGAGVVGGYGCTPGGASDPCVPPANLPYYHPGVAVTRLQMTKFIDLGRRNIADAVGTSLAISGTAYNTLVAQTTSGGSAIVGSC